MKGRPNVWNVAVKVLNPVVGQCRFSRAVLQQCLATSSWPVYLLQTVGTVGWQLYHPSMPPLLVVGFWFPGNACRFRRLWRYILLDGHTPAALPCVCPRCNNHYTEICCNNSASWHRPYTLPPLFAHESSERISLPPSNSDGSSWSSCRHRIVCTVRFRRMYKGLNFSFANQMTTTTAEDCSFVASRTSACTTIGLLERELSAGSRIDVIPILSTWMQPFVQQFL